MMQLSPAPQALEFWMKAIDTVKLPLMGTSSSDHPPLAAKVTVVPTNIKRLKEIRIRLLRKIECENISCVLRK
jgi:hypothetical protein